MDLFSYASWSDFRAAASFNFSDVSNIDQRLRTFEVHAGFVTARIGIHR
jgi:hypothetical protein